VQQRFQKFLGFRLAVAWNLHADPLIEKWVDVVNQSGDLA
jgi:hypothetical protein